jgi:hypothetical protein
LADSADIRGSSDRKVITTGGVGGIETAAIDI